MSHSGYTVGMFFKSKHAADCRPAGSGEARVTIYTKAGALVCRKIGHFKPDGTCVVEWLKVQVKAKKEGPGYVYRIPTEPGELAQEDASSEEAAA